MTKQSFLCQICQEEDQSKKSYKFQFQTKWGMTPHPDKQATGGQDALFISKNILAVADGVSGWIQYGIDPGIYSKKLIEAIAQLIHTSNNILQFIQNPILLLRKSLKMVTLTGSTTLTILTLHPQTGTLRVYSIGDSLYALFQRNTCKYLMKQQQHSFNWPYQIGNGINSSIDQQDKYGDVNKGEYRQFSYFQLQNKLIMIATDGLWDNITLQMIQQCIKKNLTTKNGIENHNSKKIIKDLIKEVKEKYKLKQYSSPFYQKAIKKGLQCQKNAKIDDLTILMAKIIKKRINKDQIF